MSKLLADNFYSIYNKGIKLLNEKKYKEAKETLCNAFDALKELSTDKTFKEEEILKVGEGLLSLIKKINENIIKENNDKIENSSIENEIKVKDENISNEEKFVEVTTDLSNEQTNVILDDDEKNNFESSNEVSENIEEEISVNDAIDKALESSKEINNEVSNNDKLDSEKLFKDAAFKFDWDSLPIINFDDIAGLDEIKTEVKTKVLLPLKNPDAFKGYVKKSGGGLFLYGPPGTGKTMIAAAIANEIGAKFCSVKPSDLLQIGVGNTEKAVRELFLQARSFPCSVIYFDEMDSIAMKNTKSSISKQLRSELLAQLQGIESYGEDSGHILFLIAATNKPWDVDSAFVRPGRFGTKIYVGLPDDEARKYLINKRFDKIKEKGVVSISDEINIDEIVAATAGFNGADISNLLDSIEDSSIIRCLNKDIKTIEKIDIDNAFEKVHSSVQQEDIEKLKEWTENNNS